MNIVNGFQANLKDAGNYALNVSSSIFHQRSVTFQIVIEENEIDPSPAYNATSTLLVALLVPLIISVIVIVGLSVSAYKQKKIPAGESKYQKFKIIVGVNDHAVFV